MTEEHYSDIDKYYTYEYDENGNLLKYAGYYSDGSCEDYAIYELDGDGNRVKYSYYCLESLEEYRLYEYDSNGNLIKSCTYDSDGTLTYYTTREYESY